MNPPENYTALPPVVPDRVRINIYYEDGLVNNIEVSLNHDDLTPEEIGQLVQQLTERCVQPHQYAPRWINPTHPAT